jgi:ParB family chromosome partitioning protein
MHDYSEPAAITASDAQPDTAIGASDQRSADSQAVAVAGRRLMIAVSELTAHPGNVREDLSLTPEFVASIAAEGVRIPLLITTSPGGGWLVIEGHRRLAAAVQAGLAEVPCDIDPGRAGDEAGQFLDMLLANSDGYRANYTVLEETAALFAAHEAGASRTRIRKATGRTAAQVKTCLAAGGLSEETRAQAAELGRELTLEDLAVLAEFDGDADATSRLLGAVQHGYPVEHTAERIRQDRAEAAEHDRLRASLQAAGVPVTADLPSGAAWLTSLSHDGQDLTDVTHASCPGHGAAFRAWNLLHPSYYCTSPAGYGHASRWVLPGAASTGGDRTAGGQPGAMTLPDPGPDPDRRLVVHGNKAWQAAAGVRHRWLAASLFPRRAAPREAQAFLARQLLVMTDPVRSGLATAGHKALFAALTGHDAAEWERSCDTATTGRLTVLMLAPVITAYEHAMTEAEGRNTWRTDRYSPCPRAAASSYLTLLASLGYQLSSIEQAVADGVTWTGGTPDDGVLRTGDQTGDGTAGAEEPGSAEAPAVPAGERGHGADETAGDGVPDTQVPGSDPAGSGAADGIPGDDPGDGSRPVADDLCGLDTDRIGRAAA